MKKRSVVACIVSIFLAMALMSDYVAGQQPTPKVAVLGSVNLKTNVTAQNFEAKFGGNTRAALEAEYKNAKGLVAVYRLKGSNLGVGSVLRSKPADYAYLQLWDSADNVQRFWSPDGKADGRGKFKELRPEVLKLGKVEFSSYDLEPVLVLASVAPKVAVLGSVNLKTEVKAQDFEAKFGGNTRAALEAEYKNARGLVAVYRLKASNVGIGSALRVKAADYGYLQLWDSADNVQRFWSPDGKAEGRGKFKELRPEVLKLGKVAFSTYDLEPVAIR